MFAYWRGNRLSGLLFRVKYSNDAFPLCGTTRDSTVQNGMARLGLCFHCSYSCAASTAVTPEKLLNSASLHHALAGSAPRLLTRGQSVLPQQTTKQKCFWLLKERCVLIQNSCIRSFAGWADLNLAGLLCLELHVQWRRQWRCSLSNQWSAVYTSLFVSSTIRLEPRPKWY